MSWNYKNTDIHSIDQLPPNTFGFIYRIVHKDSGKSYIGKKVLYFNRKQRLGKKELALFEGRGRPPKFKIVTKESDWLSYWGSNKELMKLSKESPDEFTRDILVCCDSKKHLTYHETKLLFIYEVLEKPTEFYNDNILAKFYTRDFE